MEERSTHGAKLNQSGYPITPQLTGESGSNQPTPTNTHTHTAVQTHMLYINLYSSNKSALELHADTITGNESNMLILFISVIFF